VHYQLLLLLPKGKTRHSHPHQLRFNLLEGLHSPRSQLVTVIAHAIFAVQQLDFD